MPFGNLANASSVGAKTVNGPAPLRVSTRPAAFTAVTSVLNDPAATAVSTMSIGRRRRGPGLGPIAAGERAAGQGRAP